MHRTPDRLGRRYADPALIEDEEAFALPAVKRDPGPPSWLLIAAAWCAGLALIVMTWSF